MNVNSIPSVIWHTLDDTHSHANQVAARLLSTDAQSILGTRPIVVLLDGDLGAGKTSWVKQLISQLGIKGPVKSPTYSLCELYDIHHPPHNFQVVHMDVYRFSQAHEWYDGGFEDYLAPQHVLIIEWAKNLGDVLPSFDLHLDIHLSHDTTNISSREVFYRAHGSFGHSLLK